MRYEVGVDEAGRGPLAGPVAVGVAVIPVNFDWKELVGVTDSKKLSASKRAKIFKKATQLKQEGKIDFAVSMVSAQVIDKKGIVPAIKLAMNRALRRVRLDPKITLVKLDGGLYAPAEYLQETIIKGDQKEKIIGLASICAKETRDSYMIRKSTLLTYAPYDFKAHKGYGTKVHREAIGVHGLSVEHRASFCKNCVK